MLGSFLLLLLSTTLPNASGAPTYYTMRRGDTLYSIARRFDVPLDRLMEANSITDPTRVAVGTVLLIPEEAGGRNASMDGEYTFYTVKRGDTLYGIARRFGIDLEQLLALNGLSTRSVIKPGQKLKVPGRSTDAAEVAAGKDGSAGREEGGVYARGVPFWPHDGEVTRLNGKLSGAVTILGEEGDRVVSVSPGRVMWAGPFRGFGRMVFVKGLTGLVYGYGGHRQLSVKVGDAVTVGTELGRLGVNAHDKKAKVFFFITKQGKPQDPSTAPRNP